jgi:hypothetical protein
MRTRRRSCGATWGLTLAAIALPGCHRSDSSPGEPASSTREAGSAPVGSNAPAASGAGPCLTPAIVAPFAHYSDDMIRGLATDGESVYFRTLRETFRVPLAGGTPAVIGKSPPGMDGPMWVIGDDLVAQPTGHPALVAMPRSGGTWRTLADATSDKSGGGAALPTMFNNVHRGRIEAAGKAVFDGKNMYFIEKDIAGATISGAGKSTWSVRRMGLPEGRAATLFASDRELQDIVKAGDSLFFQRNETVRKPVVPGAKKPMFEVESWSLLSLPAGGGNPSVRVPSVHGTAMASDGAAVYYTANVEAEATTHFPKSALYRLLVGATGSPELVDDWTIEPKFGAPYGAESFVLFIHAFEHVSATGIPSDITDLLYLGKRGAEGRGKRACLAQGSNAHSFAVAGSALLFASQLNDGSGAQGIVKYFLP